MDFDLKGPDINGGIMLKAGPRHFSQSVRCGYGWSSGSHVNEVWCEQTYPPVYITAVVGSLDFLDQRCDDLTIALGGGLLATSGSGCEDQERDDCYDERPHITLRDEGAVR